MLECLRIVTPCFKLTDCQSSTLRWMFRFCAGIAAAAALVPAYAAGLAGGSSAVLGQTLDFPVQVRLEADELLTPECLAAEVTLGDRRLPAGLVRTALEMKGPRSALVRVLTTVAVDEPVVGVLLNANCGEVRLSRRFVLLADPPVLTNEPQTAAVSVPAFAAVPVDVAAAAGMDGAAIAAPDGSPVSADTPPLALGGAPSAPALGRSAGLRQVAAAASAPATRSTRRAERKSAVPRGRAARPAQRAPAPAAPSLEATSRLRLEPAELQPATTAAAVDSALAAVTQAASAARAAASAASVAAARVASLEGEVDGLRKEAAASRELVKQLRERLARDDSSGRWTWPLVSLALLFVVLAAWLAWRLNAADRTRQRGWQTAAAPAPAPASELTPSKLPTAPIPFVTSELSLPGSAPTRNRPLHAWPAPAPVDTLPPLTATRNSAESRPDPDRDPAMQRTEVLPPQSAIDGAAARDVSIEELIDLEQQAEFFVVLGQDDAAIELLAEHLRNTGGGSPLPYLKLLEIYHRRGENEHYERIRTRFNQRFNAYAPAWGVDLQAGRSLDSYPGVVPRLQQVWSRPLDAMAELEALLFGKSQGQLFDLPAYREVLFLYSLARDLLDREDRPVGSVDLLLPLSDGGEFGSTAPTPFVTEMPDNGTPVRTVEQLSLTPLDFDLSVDTSSPTSLFGTPDGMPDRPSRR